MLELVMLMLVSGVAYATSSCDSNSPGTQAVMHLA
jgi:hypothetical protein